jgi:hypothetical protein
MPKLIDLTRERFGRLIVIKRMNNDKYRNSKWLCKCDCGKEKIISGPSLRNNKTKSCGCLYIKHGHSRVNKITVIYES